MIASKTTLKYVDIPCGTSILDAVNEGVRIAQTEQCVVVFELNGCVLVCGKDSKEIDLLNYYHKYMFFETYRRRD